MMYLQYCKGSHKRRYLKMIKIKTLIGKAWVFAAAAAIIIGSSSAMAFALNSSIPESSTADTGPAMTGSEANAPARSMETEATEYTVVDTLNSYLDSDTKKAVYDKLEASGFAPEQMEEKYQEIIANMTPGEKDMTAGQAAAYAADIVKKAYGTDLTGYIAQASFSRNPAVPNSDNWGVFFHAPQENNNSNRYYASVDSVSGIMLDAGWFNLDDRDADNKNLNDPAWVDTAVRDIEKLIPDQISVTGTKVVSATEAGGVMVVCELSDGSAFAVRLTGENKDAAAYQYFPNGYDGSWDYHKPTENGVG